MNADLESPADCVSRWPTMPRDYLPLDLVRRVRKAARERCGCCLSPQWLAMARLEIEHIIPLAHGGTDDESNLWLSCPPCNRAKADRTSATDSDTGAVVPLFHPRRQLWSNQFEWSQDGLRIVGRTPTGRATVAALRLDNDPDALVVRSYWVLAGWRPPSNC